MFASLHAFIRNGFEQLLDIAFPPSMRIERVRTYASDSIAITPRTHMSHGVPITTLTDYRESAIQDLIRALKYERSAHAARLIASAFADYLAESLSDMSLFTVREIVLVPVPLAPKRARERGYNQIALVLSELARLGIMVPVRDDLLIRIRETSPQTRLSRRERLTNVKGAFAVPGNISLRSLHILLIDDVTTTGATLAHAARTLERSGAKVTALAFAHA